FGVTLGVHQQFDIAELGTPDAVLQRIEVVDGESGRQRQCGRLRVLGCAARGGAPCQQRDSEQDAEQGSWSPGSGIVPGPLSTQRHETWPPVPRASAPVPW